MDSPQELAALDRMIASKLRKLETTTRELRSLVRQRERLLSDTAEEADTDVEDQDRASGRALAAL